MFKTIFCKGGSDLSLREVKLWAMAVAEKAASTTNRLAKCQLDIFRSMGIDRRGKIR